MKIFNNDSRGARTCQLALAAVLMLGIHWLTTSLPRGWLSWATCLPAWAIIITTAIARLNDITATGKKWFVRRIGLILVASGTASLALSPVLGYAGSYPSWRAAIVFWGLALAWLTTPHMPPWWKYISGEETLQPGEQA